MSSIPSLIDSLTNHAAKGTGIVKLVGIAKKALHLQSNQQIPDALIIYLKDQQQSQFGSYPDHNDVSPSSVFTAVFSLLMLGHLFVFIKNNTRGHWFPLSLGFATYCLIRLLGFALRIAWAKDILRLHTGIASEVMLVLPTVFLASLNLVLAQRLFTWRHPVGGNQKFFQIAMMTIYLVVVAVVIMTIVAGVVPYLYFLNQSHYNMCRNVVKVTSVLICFYSLLAILLVLCAFLIPPSSRDKKATVFQPFWITSFAPTYYAPRGAAEEGQYLFVQRHGELCKYSERTILKGGDLYSMADEPSQLNQFEAQKEAIYSIKHNSSILLVAITSACVLIGAVFRCVLLFFDTTYATQGWLAKPVVMYMLWGFLEAVVNLLYLLGRVDLRFYRPDKIPNKLITATDSNVVPTSSEDKPGTQASPSVVY
ncbi:hypothetical protein KL935_000822 [Ogataea polymorpha]|nr:hypothetical protein KL935_000822 [Ogataea polymorpha]